MLSLISMGVAGSMRPVLTVGVFRWNVSLRLTRLRKDRLGGYLRPLLRERAKQIAD
jgi:hypothetical protein